MKIWRLESNSKNWLSVSTLSILSLDGQFEGERLPENWIPPPFQILGKSKKVPDYIGWVLNAPLVTERFANTVRHWESEYIQLLPFDTIKKKKVYAMNVIKIQKNILDFDKSEISYLGEDKKSPSVKRVIFKDLPENLPPIFKIEPEIDCQIYVSEEFCKLVVQHQFTGLALADPTVDSFKLIIRNQNRNVYPGVPE